MSTCEHDRQDDVCWECKDQHIAALEDDLKAVVGALSMLYQHTKNNYQICALNTAAKEALELPGVVALKEKV